MIARDVEVAHRLRGRAGVAWEVHRVPGGRLRRRWAAEALAAGVRPIAISSGVAEDLAHPELGARDVPVEHDAVDEHLAAALPDRSAARQRLGLDSEQPIALYAGGLLRWKGVDVLVDAARDPRLAGALVLVVGGMDRDVAALRARAAGASNVRVDGFRPAGDIPLYLAAADVGVVPNRATPRISSHYTSPLKVFEALACGLPLVVSDLPSLRDVLDDGTATFVEAEDAGALAGGIATLLDDPGLRARPCGRGETAGGEDHVDSARAQGPRSTGLGAGGAGMKVVFLTDSLSDLDGVGRYSVRLISALEALRPDLEVHVLLARKHRPTSADVPSHWRVEVALPPDYFFYMTPSRFRVWRWLGTWRTRRAPARRVLVHAIKDYPHSLIGVDAAERAGIPCVATGHGTYTIQPVKADGPHRARALDAYSRFAAMISVSRYTRRRLLEIVPAETLPPERVHVVPNAVSAAHYAEPRALEGGPLGGDALHPRDRGGQGAQGPPPGGRSLGEGRSHATRPASRPGGQQDRGRLRALPRRARSRGGRRGSAAPGGEHRRGREGRPASARRGLPAHAGHGGGRRLRGLRHRLPGGGGRRDAEHRQPGLGR